MTCIASQSSKEILHDYFIFSPLPPVNEVCEGYVSQVFLCPQGVGSLSGGVSVLGGLCPGSLCQGDPPYGYVRAVRILLEYILVVKGDCFLGNFSQIPGIFLMLSTRL